MCIARLLKKFKKISFLTVAVLLACVALFTVSGCGHKHVFVNTETSAPNCREPGTEQGRCQCGEVSGEPVSVGKPLGHDFGDDVCLRCGQKKYFAVSKIEFVIGGATVESCTAEAYSGAFNVSVKLNDGMSLSDYAAPKISWSFKGEAHGSTVTEDGTVTLGEFIGDVVLSVTVVSENELTAELPISVIAGESLGMNSLAVTLNDGYAQNYVAGEKFDPDSIAVWGEHKNGVIRIYGFEVSDKVLTAEDTDVTVTFGDLATDLPILVEYDELLSIEVVAPASRLEYLEGQKFEREGMVIRAVFENSTKLITDFQVDEITPLALGVDSAVISYTFNGVTVSVVQPITVLPKKLSSLDFDYSEVRTVYTRGDVFNPRGLVIKATYEGFDEEIELEYTFVRAVLSTDVTFVEITFTPEDEPVTEQIPITVLKPYTEFSQVKVLDPSDVSLTWSYSYLNDEGVRVVDNTAYMSNGLKYDKINGVYDIPLGATVTAYVMNPAVINLSLNGYEQTMNYEEKTVSWIMGNADIVVIESIEMGGAHSVVRFAGQDAEMSFLYEGSWNGYLSVEDINRLSIVFADSSEYYYTYLINGVLFTFDQLKDAPFGGDTQVAVMRNARSVDSTEFILHIDGDTAYSVYISKGATLSSLPVFTKRGYEYGGWAFSFYGAIITEDQFAEMFDASETCELYLKWIKESVDYSDKQITVEQLKPSYGSGDSYGSSSGGDVEVDNYGSSSGNGAVNMGHNNIIGGSNPEYILSSTDFAGRWEYEIYSDDYQWCRVRVYFYADGTFEYTVTYNGYTHCNFYGNYRLENNIITVIYVESYVDGFPMISGEDFGFAIGEDALLANIVLFDGEGIILIPCELEKYSGGIILY